MAVSITFGALAIVCLLIPPIVALALYWVHREQGRRDFLAGKPRPTPKDTP